MTMYALYSARMKLEAVENTALSAEERARRYAAVQLKLIEARTALDAAISAIGGAS